MADDLNPFADAAAEVMHQQAQGTAAQIRANVMNASGVNPDQAAQYQHLAKYTGVPVESVQAQPELVKQQAAAQRVNADDLVSQYPTLAKYLTDPRMVDKSHDDIPTLAAVETAVRALPKPAPAAAQPTFGDDVRENVKALFGAGQHEGAVPTLLKGAWASANKMMEPVALAAGVVPSAYDKAASLMTGKDQDAASSWYFKHTVDPLVRGAQMGNVDPQAPFITKASASAGGLVAMLAAAYATGGASEAPAATAALTEIAKAALGHGTRAMAIPSLGEAIDTGRRVYAETGDAQAAIRSAEMAYATSTLGGVMPLNAPGKLVTRLVGGGASGLVTGEVSREAMNLVLPGSMQAPFDLDSAILSAVTGAALAGVMGPRNAQLLVTDAVRATYAEAAKAEAAEKGMQAIQALGELAASSKLRERDPQAFRDYVNSMTEDGALPDVYVRASDLEAVLHQSGVTDLAAKMPEVAQQLTEARETNGDVRIPVADYATHIAGGPVDASLLPHLKTAPDGMTFAEGQQALAKQQEQMQAHADEIVAQKAKQDQFQTEGQTIHDNLVEQLTGAGRTDAQAKAYAAFTRDFYLTQAERNGMTPAELFAQHPLKVTGEATGGFAQSGPAGPEGAARAAQPQSRGSFNPRSETIGLLKDADLSTYLHETGHFFLNVLHELGSRDAAAPGARSDFDTLLKWFGVKDAETWSKMSLDEQRPHHEKFAQGFEKYLMEGKAPSLELQGLFSRFRAWLVQTYRSLTALNVELTPEVRGVMDRLLASDDAIREAEQVRGYRSLFETAPEGAKPEDFAAYQALAGQATEKATADMTARSIKDMQWLSNAKGRNLGVLQKTAKVLRDIIHDQVTQQVEKSPVEQARAYLAEHGGPDELTAAQLKDWTAKQAEAAKQARIDAKAEALSKTDVKGLAKGQFLAKNKKAIENDAQRRVIEWERENPKPKLAEKPVDLDIVAEMHGFASGEDLGRALIETPAKKDLIQAITDQRMLEEHGELIDPVSVERAAEESIHNEARARMMATGLKMLSHSPIPAKQLAAAAKQAADAAIAARRIKDLRPAQHAAAEARANADTLKLAAKDPQGAVQAQRAALLNNRLFKAASDALAEVTKGVDYLRKFAKASVREKVELEYRDQIDALLERFDLRKSGFAEATQNKEALQAFVERMSVQGYEPQIPEAFLNEARRQHYKDLTVEEFHGLVDAVKSIEKLGKLKTEALDGAKQRSIQELAAEATKVAAELPQRADETNRGLTRMGAKWLGVKQLGRSLQAALLKMEQMFDWLDNRNPNGVFNRVVFRRIADAGVREADLQAKVKARLDELVKSHLADVTKEGGKIYVADGLVDGLTGKAQRFTKKEMLALAGNMGNESNTAKLLKGEKWSEPAVWAFLHKNMTKADWDFVAGLGRTMEGLWPEKLAMSKRLGNTAPDKIEPRPFDTPHGRYEGWYWPMVYDPARARDVAERGAKQGDALFENIYTRANTDTGRANTRVESYARPLLLSIDALPRIIKDEIHDVAYREAIIDADKFLSNGDVRKAVESALSPEHYEQLRPWLQSIANDRKVDMQALKWFDRAAHGLRTRATMVGLGYRLSTMLMHGTTAAAESVAELGPRWTARGVAEFKNPIQSAAFVFEHSGEMRNRSNEVDRDVREHMRELDLRMMDPATGAIQRGADLLRARAYQGIAMLDMASALPTWMGAYLKAMTPEGKGGLGLGEQDAVYFADKTVRNAHGGSGVKDMAAVQRGPEFFKLFTMFYTFWNHNVNRIIDTARQAKDPNTWRDSEKAGMVILRTLTYIFLTQTIHHKFSSAKTEDGEPDYFKEAAKDMALSAAAGIPGARDLSAHWVGGKDYNETPLAGMVAAFDRTGQDAIHAAMGEDVSDKWLKHTITTAGYVFGLPLGQPASTIQFLWDVEHGTQDPQDIADWWRGIVHGDMKKH